MGMHVNRQLFWHGVTEARRAYKKMRLVCVRHAYRLTASEVSKNELKSA